MLHGNTDRGYMGKISKVTWIFFMFHTFLYGNPDSLRGPVVRAGWSRWDMQESTKSLSLTGRCTRGRCNCSTEASWCCSGSSKGVIYCCCSPPLSLPPLTPSPPPLCAMRGREVRSTSCPQIASLPCKNSSLSECLELCRMPTTSSSKAVSFMAEVVIININQQSFFPHFFLPFFLAAHVGCFILAFMLIIVLA